SITPCHSSFFFFRDPPPTEIYTLSLHDALPISEPEGHEQTTRQPIRNAHEKRHPDERNEPRVHVEPVCRDVRAREEEHHEHRERDRKSTRLNSSHLGISYAVFCLKKKKKKKENK